MLSFTKTQLSSIRVLSILYRISTLNRCVYWRKHPGALQAVESKALQMQQELLALQRNHDADIQQAVGRAVSQYQTQLNAAQSCKHKHQVMIQQLCEQVKTLKLSLASRADLPSVGQTQEEVDLWEEVFNILPGTVIVTCGAAVYNSPDQPFSFQKHV